MGAMVLFLPGIAWQALFWDPDEDIFERLAETIGVSISLTAMLALYAHVIGWRISSVGLIILYILLIPPAAWAIRRWLKEQDAKDGITPESGENDLEEKASPDPDGDKHSRWGNYIALTLIFLIILVWRFYQIRSLVLPVWVDSVHHVQIVKLFLESGGLPDTFEPYMPVPFFYHYAFHALAAVYSFLGRLNPENSVLYLGQILNAAIAIAFYRLGKALWSDWRRAALAAVLVAFVTQMPAYYVTWGRYTLLIGMLLLPLAMATALDIINKGARRSRIATLIVLTAGILLSHYFAAVLLAIFLIIIATQVYLGDILQKKLSNRRIWISLSIAALVGLMLAGPWLFRMWDFAQGAFEVGVIQPSLEAVETHYFQNYLSYLWRLLGPDRNHVILFLAIPGLIITLFRKRTRSFGIWTLILITFGLPWGVYVAPFRPDHVAIVLFLPTAMLISELFISAIDWSTIERFTRLKTIMVLILFTALVGWGIVGTRSVINPVTVLATKADLEAINWIDRNIPEEARFFINVAHWQYGIYRGVDGGWWITPLTDRSTIFPNGLYAMGDQNYVNRINTLAEKVSQLEGCTPDFWEVVRAEELTHIYINQVRGSVRKNHFEDCPGVELIHENDGVFIYRIGYIMDEDT
jgi:hypothetical protein